MKTLIYLLLFVGAITNVIAQDTIVVHDNSDFLNRSSADMFHLYSFDNQVSFEHFISNKEGLESRELNASIENLDFTTGTFFIDFVVANPSEKPLELILETARPITNIVELFDVSSKNVALSGDGIPFSKKEIYNSSSMLPISVDPNSSKRYILKLGSDGEIISLPMILWTKSAFQQGSTTRQFLVGLFYGIFIFVIIIYLTFYYQLRDSLFLLYSLYVLFSGLLQFSLDGYLHQFIFTNGGYLTQHSIIVVAGLTVYFALMYAQRYLELKGRTKKITIGFALVVIATVVISLIPGKLYEICYPLINGFSLLGVMYLLIVAVRLRRQDQKVSNLFFIGLLTLMVGAVIFILGNFSVIDIPSLTQNSLKFGTLIEIICLSILMAGKYKTLQEEKEAAQKQLLVELSEKNRIVEEANIRLEEDVKARTAEIEQQRILLKEKNEDLVGSIKYAERIQKALLSDEEKFKRIIPESFIFFKPKDIVSGDFYWIEEIEPTERWQNGLIVYATADCTGHGVPGAFVSIICNNLLKIGKTEKSVQGPGDALDFVNQEINQVLNSNYSGDQIRDGMDIALCAIDPKARKLYFSGAKNGVVIIRDEEIIELKGDRKPIGYSDSTDDTGFSTQETDLKSGDMLFTFSDGYVDQFGGPEQKKFMSKRLKELCVSISKLPVEEQRDIVSNTFEKWKEGVEQIDDVLLIGVRIN